LADLPYRSVTISGLQPNSWAAAVAATADVAVLATAEDYLGLTAEQRYNVVSQYFPLWLLTEPIEFPAHHPTYGWACRVDGCDGVLPAT
jgi:hypothetical protein